MMWGGAWRWVAGLSVCSAIMIGCGGRSDTSGGATPARAPASTSGLTIAADTVDVEQRHVTHFGFVGVGCGLDHLLEVEGFTNVATTCAIDAATAPLLAAELDSFADVGVEALLNVEPVFFDASTEAIAPNGAPRRELRSDFAQRWADVIAAADLAGRADQLWAVYPADEPMWRGVDPGDLEVVYDHLAATLPGTPRLLIEAASMLDELTIPKSVDLVAFDRYGIADPGSDPTYQADYERLKALRSRPDQHMVVILDAQWVPDYRESGLEPVSMGKVAQNYHRFATQDPDVVALIGYAWPTTDEITGLIGARDLPPAVIDAYREIGARIVGGVSTES